MVAASVRLSGVLVSWTRRWDRVRWDDSVARDAAVPSAWRTPKETLRYIFPRTQALYDPETWNAEDVASTNQMLSELYVPVRRVEAFGTWLDERMRDGEYNALFRYTLRYVHSCRTCRRAACFGTDLVAIAFHEPGFRFPAVEFYKQAAALHAAARARFNVRANPGLVSASDTENLGDVHTFDKSSPTTRIPNFKTVTTFGNVFSVALTQLGVAM